MLATRNMNRQNLLNCDDDNDDGNNVLEEFYVENLPTLMLYPISDVPHNIIRAISVLLHGTLLFPSDWQEYATKLGVTDYFCLLKIQASARAVMDQELFITLKRAIPHKMFGHVISVLLADQRFDVLKRIHSDVKELLETTSNTEVKEVASIHGRSFEFKAKELTNTNEECNSEAVSSIKSLNYKNREKHDSFAPNPSLLNKYDKQEDITLFPVNKDVTLEMQSHTSVANEPLHEENSVQKINLFPTAPAQESVTVFIQHTEIDSYLANDLSKMLISAGFIVRTLSEMENLVAMDQTREALTRMFQEVDFIVPIVSEKFLKQIHPISSNKYHESTDTQDNRWLYKLITNEYISNKCINFRVRPVIVPKMNRQLLITDVILSYSFRLWGEVPKLIRILNETKKLMPQFR